MIKKLRRKFVIINMSLVAVILCVVLGMFCFTRIHTFRAESEIAMRHSVHNTGKALSEEDLPHLFERFYRADDSRGEKSGFGLGLSIAATVAQEHKASLRAESDWDSTRFLFTISLRR